MNISVLVSDEVSGWNPLLTSLLHLEEKLEELGIVYLDEQAIYVEANWS
jgi:hypothetical protein